MLMRTGFCPVKPQWRSAPRLRRKRRFWKPDGKNMLNGEENGAAGVSKRSHMNNSHRATETQRRIERETKGVSNNETQSLTLFPSFLPSLHLCASVTLWLI